MTRKSEDLMHYLESLQVLQVYLNLKKKKRLSFLVLTRCMRVADGVNIKA